MSPAKKKKRKHLPCCLLHCIAVPKPRKNEEGLKFDGSIGIITNSLAYIQNRAKPWPGTGPREMVFGMVFDIGLFSLGSILENPR